MKIITIVGARPQFVKAAVVSRAFKKNRSNIKEVIVHTGQHYDVNMSDVFFKELEIPLPDYFLNIGGGTHGQNTGRMVESIETVLLKEKPDWIIVYGDTDSTLAGCLAAVKLHIPVAHVEAGLRSFNRNMPEEINRILTDHASNILFTPTEVANKNLKNEGITNERIQLVGDVMYDATLYYKSKAKIVQTLNVETENFILTTLHRAENTDNLDRLSSIINALRELTNDLDVILPLHPRTRAIIAKNGLDLGKIQPIDPVGYLEMIWLLENCKLVVTDSGGLQKEAFFFQKPCITTRDETEWVELVESGYNKLVGANTKKIVEACKTVKLPSRVKELYGDGNSGKKIVDFF